MTHHELLKAGDKRYNYGLTAVVVDSVRRQVHITHTGNMGNNINSVEANINKCLGPGTWCSLEYGSRLIDEDGDPGYYYTRVLHF